MRQVLVNAPQFRISLKNLEPGLYVGFTSTTILRALLLAMCLFHDGAQPLTTIKMSDARY